MITAKEAVAAATKYMRDIYSSLEGLDLEEIELDEDKGLWRVTMGFWQPLPAQGLGALAVLERRVKRVYKELRIKADDGTVIAMKIRPLPSP